MTTRRTFMMSVAATGAVLTTTRVLATTTLSETDPQAIALGYVTDTTKADSKKYPKHAASQMCDGCALWQSKPTDALGNCALFPGKQVHAKGWCSAWNKKA